MKQFVLKIISQHKEKLEAAGAKRQSGEEAPKKKQSKLPEQQPPKKSEPRQPGKKRTYAEKYGKA